MFKRRDETGDPTGGTKGPSGPEAQSTFLRPSLGPDTSVTGRLSFEAPTRIDGKLRGEVRADDLLVIGETGLVEGVVRAVRLVVHGQVHGEIRGAEHVEIISGANVSGILEAQCLVVHEGATLDSEVTIAPPRAETVHLLHPTTPV